MLRMHIGFAFLALLLTARAAAAEELAVIVNVANTTAALDAKAVKARFLKTLSTWSTGDRVRSVDQTDATPKRAAFLAKVLGMSPAELERYWIEKQYANADTPPAKAPDDATVIRIVKTFKGAIGFVSKEAAEREGVKVVLILQY
jgi:ABC-type phosphate transport system substrate-binding protein